MDQQEEAELSAYFDGCARRGVMSEFTAAEAAGLALHHPRWEIRAGQRVLEPGCGSGRLTRLLAEWVGEAGEVLGLDLSPEMIRKAEERGLPAQACARVGSVCAIPAGDSHFDRVICFNAFPHFDRRDAALREMARVLKPGGTLWISHLQGSRSLNLFHRSLGGVVGDHLLPDFEEMEEILHAARFQIVDWFDGADGYSLCATCGGGAEAAGQASSRQAR